MAHPLVGSCTAPRNIYIDAGVNWCNTVHLFRDIDPNATAGYEVFGFEASPLIQSYADEYFAWRNGDRPNEPLACLPQSGSTIHLAEYASVYNCPPGPKDKMRDCMFKKLDPILNALKPNPALNSSALIHDRLDRARLHCGAVAKSRFTFIPAAVAAYGDAGWINLFGHPQQLIRGGAISSGSTGGPYNFWVHNIDLPEWIETSFAERDHIILKMDVEGAEHTILEEMVRRGLFRMIDTLSLECHNGKTRAFSAVHCKSLVEQAKHQNPKLHVLTEGTDHKGYDQHTLANQRADGDALARACSSINPRQFKVTRIGAPPDS